MDSTKPFSNSASSRNPTVVGAFWFPSTSIALAAKSISIGVLVPATKKFILKLAVLSSSALNSG